MMRRLPTSPRTHTLFPYTTLFRPLMTRVYNDGTNAYFNIYDIGARVWYRSDPVAKPASWTGYTGLRDTNRPCVGRSGAVPGDRKSTPLNSRHLFASRLPYSARQKKKIQPITNTYNDHYSLLT